MADIPSRSRDGFTRRLIAVLAVVLVALLLGGGLYYRSQERRVRNEVEANLVAIESLKVDQISRWRQDRLADATLLGGNAHLIVAIPEWSSDRESPESAAAQSRLDDYTRALGYRAIIVVDASGTVLRTAGSPHLPLTDDVLDLVRRSLETHDAYISDLHKGSEDSVVHIDTVAAIATGDGSTPAPGAVVLQTDANDFLYPLVKSWPTASPTAETLLVERSGDSVLFLNDVRHTDDSALRLKIPVDQVDVPAVMAIEGKTGIVEGRDYRGARVIAAIAPIPGSPWYMIAKIDSSDAFAGWRLQAALILGVLAALASLSAAAVGTLWQRSHAEELSALLDVERAQRESEARYQTTLLSVGDGVIVTDAECRVTLLNAVAEALTGWSFAEACGRPVGEVFALIDEDTRESLPGPVCGVLQSQTVVSLGASTILRARDGVERPVADSAAPIRDSSGDIIGVVVVFRDQTQEREAQALIRKVNVRLEEAEEHALLGSWEFPIGGEGGWWSSQMYRLFGFDPADDMPSFEEYLDAIHPDDRGRVAAALEDIAAGKHPESVEFRTGPHRGPLRILSPTVHTVTGPEGDVIALAGTMLDVTKFREVEQEVRRLNVSLEQIVDERTEELMATSEELQAANEELVATNEELQSTAEEILKVNERLVDADMAKTRFLRAMSHELRTPLNSIIGFSDIMARGLAGRVTAEQHRQLDMINHAGTHLLALINDILDLSRIEAGKVDLHVESVDVPRIAREAADSVLATAQSKGLDLEIELPDPVPDLESDTLKIKQILVNLLGNAVKFTDSGGVELRVSISSPGMISFAVSDTGPGVGIDEQERIFGEFAQGRAVPDSVHDGTGLGLAISRGLAQALGGALVVDSRPGKGSTFTLTLPMHRDIE